MTRLLYIQLLLLFSVLDWLVAMTHPEKNAGNWLAAVLGAFLLRLFIDVSTRKHVTGWLAGTIAAFLWAKTIHRTWLPGWDEFAVWGSVAFLADFVLQIIVYLLTSARDNPGAAFDAGMAKTEQLIGLWSRIKEPFTSLIDYYRNRKTP